MNNLNKRYKTGGRAKGTPNKTTKELRELLTRLLSETMEEDVRNMTLIDFNYIPETIYNSIVDCYDSLNTVKKSSKERDL